MAPFSPELQKFLKDLKAHNNKEWFERNRGRYEEFYRDAFSEFISGYAPYLARISSNFVADPRPIGGSVMRIYRDIRFSPDKTPYKTYTVVHFGHAKAGEGAAPGFYLYVAPDEVEAGAGIWHPEPAAARKVREAIGRRSESWTKITRTKAFADRFELSGESLKRPPPGIDPDHPLIEDLKRKSWIASTPVSARSFTSSKFLREYDTICRSVSPFVQFLSEAVGLPF
ncbi:MAG TPA: TIGR02453 family protein [Thermoplasmata archaeon]|nr:TIGR02453 family protein [Thermoplasmata archaeon]